MENSNIVAAKIIARPDLLTVEWSDGSASEFASVWLRDNLPEDRDRHNRQRLVDVADLPPEPRIEDAVLQETEVWVRWQGENLRSNFSLDWLRACQIAVASGPTARPWFEGASLDPRVDFAWQTFPVIQADARERLMWLRRL